MRSSAPRARSSKVVFSCVSSLLVFAAILQQPHRRPAGRGSRENQVNYNSFYNICNTIYIIGILFCRICAQLKLKQQHPPLIPDESEGDAFLTGHFFTFLQNSIRIVATCSRPASLLFPAPSAFPVTGAWLSPPFCRLSGRRFFQIGRAWTRSAPRARRRPAVSCRRTCSSKRVSSSR